MLTEHGLPATFFLTGRTLDGPSPFWWQDLQAVSSRGESAMNEMRFRLEETWPWARAAGDVRDLAATIEGLPPAERDAVAACLRALAGSEVPDPGLPAETVRELATAGFDIGFHTFRHDALPPLAQPQLEQAMHEGLEALEGAAGRRPVAISYPHCRADLRVAHAADKAGFTTGVVCSGRAARLDRPPLLTDRVNGWAPSLDEFTWNLARVAAQ
jgi:peptidoglycan/xylan/chitin deacetylase (PgdA/CDA1 family)